MSGLSTDATRSVPVHDPLSSLVYATHGDDVTFTMVDGTVVQDGGEIGGCDTARVRERAADLAARLRPA